MTEVELYKELGTLTKNKEKWKEHIPYVASLLTYDSVKIQTKALWLIGEMGLVYSQSVQNVVPKIATFLDSQTPLLRERAINAIGRIGRGSYHVIEPYWVDMFRLASDEETVVLLRGEKVDGHVEIDLDVDKPGEKAGTATYAEIKGLCRKEIWIQGFYSVYRTDEGQSRYGEEEEL